ncbi:MAG: peptidoglycan endopeptidase [Lachnospiraceae bacterium]|nr:peptidoglycan endopeptidase [Lachnospiraceae bacterium]
MNRKALKLSVMTAATVLLMSGQTIVANAESVTEEKTLGGFSYVLDQYVNETSTIDSSEITLLLASKVEIPENIAIANVDDCLNIREKAGKSYDIIGYLPKDAYCIVKEVKDGWAKITSGEVTGYVSSEYLYMGEAGYKKAKSLANLTATVTAGSVNVRQTPSTESNQNIITEVSKNEELLVVEDDSLELLTKDDPKAELWVKVSVDNVEGYVSRDYVDVSYKWKMAVKIDPVDASVSSLRIRLTQESKKYLGLRYVWGGQSLTTGADCSGFVRSLYKLVGIDITNLPRTSYDLAKSSLGKSVSLAEAKPGDLVFYGDAKGNVDHVAMYIGNNQVIHESGRTTGCKISNVTYRTILRIKNFID